MGKWYMRYLFMGWICFIAFLGVAQAGSAGQVQEWLQEQVRQHPDVLAAGKSLDAALALAEGRSLALYNPELETEYERNGDDDVYSIGISQTIDLWDKRGVRSRQADFSRRAAQMSFELVVQEKMAEALRAIVAYHSSVDLAGFAQKQEAQMNSLLGLVEKRLQAGDIGQADMELAFLGLSRRLNATAQAKANLRQVESRLSELLPDWTNEHIAIPAGFWNVEGGNLTATELDLLPAVALARAEYDIVDHQARLAKLEGKADPTFGISAGEDGEEDVVAVSFSVPLNFRNNYQAEAKAASLDSVSARQRYMAVKRQAHFTSQAALGGFEEYRLHFNKWQKLINGRGETGGKLLAQQWDSGDLSTTEYLLALDQITEGLVAGIELRTQYQLACVEWLLASGQLKADGQN